MSDFSLTMVDNVCLMNGCFQEHRKSCPYKELVADFPQTLNEHMWIELSPTVWGEVKDQPGAVIFCLFKGTSTDKNTDVFSTGVNVII